MADLLPSTSDATPAENTEPRVVGVDSDAADDVLAALSSTTARELLAALHEEPATPSELAGAVDTSLQNTQYHLGNLEDAEVVEVADTIYSEKGREMKVYAPADQPLVLFAGQKEETSTLKTALSRLLGGVGIVGAASLALHRIVGQTAVAPPTSGGGGGEEDGGVFAGDTAGGGDADGGGGGDADGDGGEDIESRDGGDDDVYSTESGDDVSVSSDDGATETAEPTGTAESADAEMAEEATVEAETPQDTATEQMTEAADSDVTTTAANETVEAANDGTASAVELGANAGLPPGLLLFVAGTIIVSVWVFFRYADR